MTPIFKKGFPGNSDGKKSACNAGASLMAQIVKNLPAMLETQVQSLGWEDLLEKEVATHTSILAWKFHGQRSLASYSPWGHKGSDI